MQASADDLSVVIAVVSLCTRCQNAMLKDDKYKWGDPRTLQHSSRPSTQVKNYNYQTSRQWMFYALDYIMARLLVDTFYKTADRKRTARTCVVNKYFPNVKAVEFIYRETNLSLGEPAEGVRTKNKRQNIRNSYLPNWLKKFSTYSSINGCPDRLFS